MDVSDGAAVVSNNEETMKMKKNVILVTLTLFAVALYVYNSPPTDKNPIPNLSPRSGEASASSEYLNAQKAVQYYRDEIQKKPEVAKNYVELAQLFLQEARVTANHHEYIPKAIALLDEALRRDPENFEAQVTKASVLMTLHQFSEAKKLSESVISQNSYSAFAYGVLCDALVELGEYDQAVKTSDKMLSIRPDLRSYARAAYLRELHGDTRGARDAMKLAADAGVNGQENRAWALYNLANLYLHEAQLDTAEFLYKGILEERPNYAWALNGLAQVRLAQGKTDEAIGLLNKALESTPEHSFLEQLADIYRSMGQRENADGTARLVLKSFEQHGKDGWNVDKEYAFFCANHDMHLQEALDRAKREYDRRPENIDALDVYAWTLYKNGRAAEALPFIERAMRLKTKNPVLHFHAAMIYNSMGDRGKAHTRLEEAFTINPFINVLYAENARQVHASLSNLALKK